MAPLDAADTHELSIGKYQLSVDTGGVTNAMKLITNGVLLSGMWEAYRWTVGAAVAMINLALQMEWVQWLVEAIKPVALTLQNDVIAKLGLRGLALVVMGLWVGCIIASGRFAKGLVQLLVSTTIAVLAAGALANPVALITGPHGVLYGARDAGQAVATVITSDGKSATPDPGLIEQKTGGAMVDTFVRLPHQMINYGRVIDGTSCQSAYDKALAGGPYDSDDDSARSAVGDCDEKLKDWADDPGWTGVGAIAILTPAGGALAALGIVLVVLIFLATLMVIFFAVKLIIDVILAILPGERSGLWSSVAGLLGAVLTVAGLIILLALYCVFLRGVLTTKTNTDMLVRFFIVDAMVISFIVVTVVARKRISERARRMAEKAAAFSGGGKARPAQMPKLSQARQAIGQAAAMRAAGGRALGGSGASSGGAVGGAAAAGGGNAAQRILQRVTSNRVVKAGVTAASLAGGVAGVAAKATIGAPVYVPRATRIVKAAARSRAAAARGVVQRKVGQGKAFAGEYRDGLATAARPAVAIGKAAGRAAAPAVTAAAIGLSTPKGAGSSAAPTAGMSSTRTGARPGASPRRTAAAARNRQAGRVEAARATAPPRPAAGSRMPRFRFGKKSA
ncbi:hypothetical protein [Kineococcus radiotolerans]|uniref:hypothetical protein n=1 Tax=Kineococcus radiotolerans TaxID=131568 RepID=UPI000326BB08|nr:hypothetical protein [Kineococcus radiotolerans]